MAILRRSDNLIRHKGPTNALTGAVLDSATVTARFYDERRECRVATFRTRLRQEAPIGATSIEVPHFLPSGAGSPLEVGSTIRFMDEEGTVVEKLIASVTPADEFDTIGFSGALAAAVPARAGVQVVLLEATIFALEVPDIAPGFLHQVEFELSDETLDMGTVLDVRRTIAYEQPVGTTEDPVLAPDQGEYTIITIGSPPSTSVFPESRLRVKVANDIALTLYGTPESGSDEWGYAGVLENDATLATNPMRVGQHIRVESEIDAGAGLKIIEHSIERVIE